MNLRLSKYHARVTGLPFIERDEAAWLAVIALLTSKAIDADFDKLFAGSMTLRARESRIVGGAGNVDRSTMKTPTLAEETDARYAIEQAVRGQQVLGKEMTALGYVLHQMLVHGVTKKAAMEDSQRFSQKAARYLSEPGQEESSALFKGRGAETVGALWKKYESVLPYVYAWSLNIRARSGGHGKVLFEDLRVMPWIFLKQIQKNSRTRPISFKKLQVIVFE